MSKALPLIEELFQKIIGPFAATDVAPLLFEPDNVEDRVSHLITNFNRPNRIKAALLYCLLFL